MQYETNLATIVFRSVANCNQIRYNLPTKMKKTSLAAADCPIARGYDAIGDWWSLLIITHVVLLHRRRFGQIQEELGMAKNILSSRLQKLVEHGILERVPSATGGSRQEYAATPKGQDLYKALVALMQWGQTYYFQDEPCGRSLVDRATGQAVAEIQVRSADGRTLGPDDLEVVFAPGASPRLMQP